MNTSLVPSGMNWAERFQRLAQESRHPLLIAFYQAGVVSQETPLEQVQMLAMDVETTGLDAQQHEIVSIGLLPFNLSRIRCGEAQYWVIKPSTELNEESVTFHRITHTDILHAPAVSEVLADLLKAMEGKVMVVHYRNIERGFLNRALIRYFGEGVQFPVIDTMQLEARLHRQPRRWWDRMLRRPLTSIRLADSRARYNLPPYQAHHALMDALATAELLQAQVMQRYSRDVGVGQLWD